MGVKLLKHRQIIDSFWTDLEVDFNGKIKPVQSLSVFKDVLENPMNNLNKFLELCEALCGKKD